MEKIKEALRKYNFDEYTDLEKARIMYIELGKIVSFSTRYNNSSATVMNSMLKADIDINTFESEEVNCVIWSQLYSQLLDSVGIQNEIEGLGHTYVELKIDNKKIIADATTGEYNDLSRIHNGDDTSHFGMSYYQTLDKNIGNYIQYNPEFDEEIKNIDKKIGYNNEKYHDLILLKDLCSKISDGTLDINSYVKGNGSTINKKLQFLFAKLGVLDFGYYEAKYFLYNIEKIILNKDEIINVRGTEIKRTNKDQSVDILEIISVKETEGYSYYVLAPNKPIKQVCEEDIIKFSLIGYGTDLKNIPGIIYPKNFIPGKISKGLKYKIEKSKEKKIVSNDSFLAEYNEVSNFKKS